MAGFKIDAFKGIRPRLSVRKLSPGEAQTAENVKLGSSDVKPWLGPNSDFTLGNGGDPLVNTIYRYVDSVGDPIWLEWDDPDVVVAPGSVKGDTFERIYYTGDGFPKMTYDDIASTGAAPYPNAFRRLGVPAPTTAPSITPTAIPESTVGNTGTIEDNMTASNFYLTIINSVWSQVTGASPPYNTRVYVDTPDTHPQVGENIDVGIELGQVFRVTVIDDDTFTLTNETSDHLTKSPIPTSPRDGSVTDSTLVMTDGGGDFFNFAGYVHAPNGLTVTQTAHGLNNNAEILVTSVNVPVRYRWNSPNTDDPPGGASDQLPYFTIDYPDTGPYPTAPDGEEVTTHECTYDAAGNYFDLFGSWTYEVIDDGDGSGTVLDSRAYVYTWVTALGEEGPPSPASDFSSVVDGESVTIDSFDTTPTSGDGYDITNLRLYRTNSSDDEANFQFIAEIAESAGTYDDTVLNADLGEILPSTNWDPPDAGMQGIISLPNGMMAGFKGKNIYMCEPYFPHAWPAIYDQAVDFDIVGLAALGNSAVIVTKGTPYILSGTHPRNVSIRPYKINQACVSRRSIVSLIDKVIYASPDGLVQIGVEGAGIISERYFKKEEWQEYNPSSMIGAVYDGLYYIFYDATALGNGEGHLVFSPDDTDTGLSTGTTTALATYVDIEDDALYYTDGTTVFQWDAVADTPLTYTWRSGKYLMNSPVNMGAGIVEAEGYPVTFRLYADGLLRATRTVADDAPFRLPGGYLASSFEIEVTGTEVINEARVAQSVFELAEG